MASRRRADDPLDRHCLPCRDGLYEQLAAEYVNHTKEEITMNEHSAPSRFAIPASANSTCSRPSSEDELERLDDDPRRDADGGGGERRCGLRLRSLEGELLPDVIRDAGGAGAVRHRRPRTRRRQGRRRLRRRSPASSATASCSRASAARSTSSSAAGRSGRDARRVPGHRLVAAARGRLGGQSRSPHPRRPCRRRRRERMSPLRAQLGEGRRLRDPLDGADTGDVEGAADAARVRDGARRLRRDPRRRDPRGDGPEARDAAG